MCKETSTEPPLARYRIQSQVQNTRTNSSSRQTGQTRLTNSPGAIYKSWLVRCPLLLRDLAKAICMILTWEVVESASMGAPWASGSCTSYTHTRFCFPSEPISNRLLHRHYQGIPPSHKSPPTRTCPHTFTSLLLIERYAAPVSPQNLPSFSLRIHQYIPQNGSKNSAMIVVAETPLFPETSPGDI